MSNQDRESWYEQSLAGNRVLHIEDNPADAHLVRTLIDEHDNDPFEVENIPRLNAAITRLEDPDAPAFDIILLDLGLPESQGLETLEAILAATENIPVVVLTGMDDQQTGREAVSAGAEDYLVKSEMGTPGLLSRTLQYAVQRSRRREQSQKESYTANSEDNTLELNLLPAETVRNGPEPLRTREPAMHRELIEQYYPLIIQAEDKSNTAASATRADQLLRQLVALDGQPSDLVDLHTASLHKAETAKPAHARLIRERSRSIILTMMARMAIFFRDNE